MLSDATPLSDWLAWLETLSPNEIDLGLRRVSDVLERLSLTMPDDILLVAGTNGKGSCVAMADALLRATGRRVGAYTSPHIRAFNERIVVAGDAANDATIIGAFAAVEAARGDAELTYFEFATLAAAVVFAAADLDIWILEVGLGGRLDATNAFEPTASLITNVSLDHCDWLGSNVEAIGFEKAGVMRSGRPTVFGNSEVPDSVVAHASECGAELLLAGKDFDVESDADAHWRWSGPSTSMSSLLYPGLDGEFQLGNAAAVLMLLHAAGLASGIGEELVNRVLPGVTLTGRLQSVRHGEHAWLLDVAHNPAAATMLAANLASNRGHGNTVALLGILDDKDIGGMVEPLLQQVDRWVAISANHPRAVAADELARQLANLSGQACYIAASIPEGMQYARRVASENDRILVTGSFFAVSPVIDKLDEDLRTET